MTAGHIHALTEGEEGHWQPALAALVAGGGLVALGVGAATDTGWLAVVGGIVGGVGLVGYDVVRHAVLDYGVFRRLDRMEGGQPKAD